MADFATAGEPPKIWAPQPGPQVLAIDAGPHMDELLYGGARGGGKSDFLLGDYAQNAGTGLGVHWRGILFRRTYPELEEIIARSKEIFTVMFPGAEFREGTKTWHFPGGETLRMRYIERDSDADHYQGHQYTWIGWDELGQWALDVAYKKIIACLRSAHVSSGLRIRASANPGGPGHQWVKDRFISPAPGGYHRMLDPDTQMHRIFIPAKVHDNRILLENDPGYVDRLRGVGSETLVRAWLEGDWNVVEGAYFDCWSQALVVRPFEIPEHWTRIRSFDWGSAAPFSCGWHAIASEDFIGPDGVIPQNAMVRYRELYGAKSPNVGVKLTAEQVAKDIMRLEELDLKINDTFGGVHDAVADPAIFAQDGGPSIAERMFTAGCAFRSGDNKRLPGWDQVRQRMIGNGERPMLYFFNSCSDSIRTVPALQHDQRKPEDLDTTGEDHAADELRYACMSRPFTREVEVEQPFAIETRGETWDEMIQRRRREADNG